MFFVLSKTTGDPLATGKQSFFILPPCIINCELL